MFRDAPMWKEVPLWYDLSSRGPPFTYSTPLGSPLPGTTARYSTLCRTHDNLSPTALFLPSASRFTNRGHQQPLSGYHSKVPDSYIAPLLSPLPQLS